ncbi:MAG: hypothetical protein AAF547_09855 [Actinomycetota bacterium]
MTTTTTDDPGRPGADDPSPSRADGSPDRLVVSARTRRHQILVAALVFGLTALVGGGAVWSADEGALLAQVELLIGGDGWSAAHPFPAADPAGTAYPLHLSSWEDPTVDQAAGPDCPADGVGCRYVSLAKHVTYLWLAAGLFAVGGYGAILALSALSTVAAAIATSKLAARIEPAAELPALWLAGLGSPLLLHAVVGWAHAPAAALFGVAVHALLVGEGPGRTRSRSLAWRVGGLLALAGACLLRTEAPLAGLALAAGWLGLALLPRLPGPSRRAVFVEPAVSARTALAVGATTVAATVVDRLTDHPTGGPVEPPSFDEAFGLIDGRIEGFANTWLRPGYEVQPKDLVGQVSAATLVCGTVMFRRAGGGDGIDPTPLVAVAVVGLLARFLGSPVALIPGLVVAFPVLFVGLGLLDRRVRSGPLAAVVVPFGLFCGAVLATQYRGGGGGEWGGRYFAVGLPLAIAAASVGLVRAGRTLGAAERRRTAALLVATMALLNTMGLLGVHSIRDRTGELGADVLSASVDAGDGDPRPVVLTTMNGLGRWMWDDLDQLRMLRVHPDEVDLVGARLADLGVERLLLVSNDPATDTAALAAWYRPAPTAAEVGASLVAFERIN